jgi:hypothetical protein
MPSLAHIVNPVNAGPDSDLVIAQPITFESIRRAAQHPCSSGDVELLAIAYEEDAKVMPDGFRRLPNLTRSVLDVGTFPTERKLPLMADILEAARDGCASDYIVYTNVDIALQPYFYAVVFKHLAAGAEAMVINRRTISDHYTSIDELELMYAETGQSHLGFDCFVLRRALIDRLNLGMVCLGAGAADLPLVLSLVKLASPFVVLTDAHMTFHIGDNQTWQHERLNAYAEHNNREVVSCAERLEQEHGPFEPSDCPTYSYQGLEWRKKLVNPLKYRSPWGKLRYRLEQTLTRVLPFLVAIMLGSLQC